MANFILAHQSRIIYGPEILIINGNKQEFKNTPEQIKTMKSVKRRPDMKEIPLHICGVTGTSTSLKLYAGNKGELLLFTNSETRDEKGRKVGIAFYGNDVQNITNFAEAFKSYMILADLEINENDITAIKNGWSLFSNRNKIYLTLIIILVAIIWAIFK